MFYKHHSSFIEIFIAFKVGTYSVIIRLSPHKDEDVMYRLDIYVL